ncbi:MAG: hypothetical protein CVU09_00260 [Bacteroidetes bacterium HGW-Bacteroidetes-4]|jgi:hypothetical protein|nr:MAG: hypothetical protein CVU09_00260 [Bacteroidetes bacterium HGW-Bacteroidetes-4]
MNNPKYNIGDWVYHITPDSPKGYILDITYHFLGNHFEYLVSFAPESASMWYYEHELQKSKTF